MRPLPLRTLLVTTAVGCLVLLYLIWGTTYAGIHFNQRYTQLAPGAPGHDGRTSIRLLSLTSTPLLADQKYDEAPKPADPGALWVVAVLEGQQPPGAPEFYCTLRLLGSDGRRWEKQDAFDRTTACDGDALKSGAPVRLEAVFLVPERDVGQIVGVALPGPTDAGPADVVTPPV